MVIFCSKLAFQGCIVKFLLTSVAAKVPLWSLTIGVVVNGCQEVKSKFHIIYEQSVEYFHSESRETELWHWRRLW